MTKNILIISRGFPPQNTIASRRYGVMTRYFEEFGWKPWVVTTEATAGGMADPIPGEQIIRVGKAEELDINLMRTEGPRKAKLRGGPLQLLRKLKSSFKFHLESYENSCFTWLKQLEARADQILQKSRPDCIIGTFSPPASLWFARDLSQRSGVPWIADFRDAGALRDITRLSWVSFIDRLVERRLLASCAGVVSVSPTLVECLARTYRKPTEVVYNGFDPSLYEEFGERSVASSQHAPDVYYAGRLYPHQFPAFELVLSAMNYIPETSLRVRLLNYHMAVKVSEVVNLHQCRDRVEILAPCEPGEALHEAQACRIGLVLEALSQKDFVRRGVLTGKLLDLLPARPPIMAVARPDSDIGHVLRATGRGQLLSTLTEVRHFLEHPSPPNKGLPASQVNAIQQFSRKVQAKRLLSFCENLLKGKSTRMSAILDRE